MVLASWRHGGSLERNSLSGRQIKLPCMGAIPCAHPLITVKPYPVKNGRRVMPWEVLCLSWRHDPVTTEPFGARLRTLSHLTRMVKV